MHKPMATFGLAMGGPTKELCNGQNRPSTDTASLYDQAGKVVAGLVWSMLHIRKTRTV